MTGHLLFVYGTLRISEHNHVYLQSAELLSPLCSAEGFLFDTGHGYPVMASGCGGVVWGELYRVTGTQLAAIDQLEDYRPEGGGEYERIRRPIHTEGGVVEAFVYVTASEPDGLMPIPGGDWCKRGQAY